MMLCCRVLIVAFGLSFALAVVTYGSSLAPTQTPHSTASSEQVQQKWQLLRTRLGRHRPPVASRRPGQRHDDRATLSRPASINDIRHTDTSRRRPRHRDREHVDLAAKHRALCGRASRRRQRARAAPPSPRRHPARTLTHAGVTAVAVDRHNAPSGATSRCNMARVAGRDLRHRAPTTVDASTIASAVAGHLLAFPCDGHHVQPRVISDSTDGVSHHHLVLRE